MGDIFKNGAANMSPLAGIFTGARKYVTPAKQSIDDLQLGGCDGSETANRVCEKRHSSLTARKRDQLQNL